MTACLPITERRKYRPNNDSGYYQSINADGSWGDENSVWLYRYYRREKTLRASLPTKDPEAFFAIFVWTVVFSVLTISQLTVGGWDGIGLPRTVGSAER